MLSRLSRSLGSRERTSIFKMSYRGGGMGYKRGRGPNRSGGRGGTRGGGGRGGTRSGGGGEYGARGRGGGGPPSELSGRGIGMFYAAKSRAKKVERERNTRAVLTISREQEGSIGRILENVRQESGVEAMSFSNTPAATSHYHQDRGGYTGGASHYHQDTGGYTDGYHQDRGGYAGGVSHDYQDTGGYTDGASSMFDDYQPTTAVETTDFVPLESGSDSYHTTSSSLASVKTEPGSDRPDPYHTSSQQFSLANVKTEPGDLESGSDSYHTSSRQFSLANELTVLPSVLGEHRHRGSFHAYDDDHESDFQSTLLKDQELFEELAEKERSNSKYCRMMEFRRKLPSWKMRQEILDVVKHNQVVVISGETGCGKTTQVPQFILDDAIRSRRGSSCHVICTQPRRISAISVAQRVAQERGEPLGRSVGFQIRLEHSLPRTHGCVLYCTTGILLRRLIANPTLKDVSHVILDEVHERNITSDFLTIIMKDLLLSRPDLKLILMSATLNAEMFSQYFHTNTSDVSFAPMFNIPNVAFPVTEYFLEDILSMTRFRPPPSSAKPRRRPQYTRYGVGKIEYQKQQAEDEEFATYVTSLERAQAYPSTVIEVLREFDEHRINLDLVLALVRYICHSMDGDDRGGILIFLPGWDTITKMNDLFHTSPVFRSSNYLIIPLHSMMPTAFQQSVFDRPPEGVRKIIIATNIAETSITIDDIVYVIDCGKVKETTYDAAHQLACLDAVWVSQAAARQRRGRAGRVQAGHCFHLFTKLRHGQMAEYQQPEMLRTPLEELVLQIKILNLGRVSQFLQKAIEPPSDEAVKSALQCLTDLNALTFREELTPLGRHLANLPVSPRIGKIILFAAMFSCLDPVLTIASSLGFKEPFVIPLYKQEEADRMKKRLAGESRSDHIALLRAFQGWEQAKQCGDARKYCWDHFLASNTLELLRNMKGQFASLLYDAGFIQSPNSKDPSANVHSDNLKLVKAVLCAGLYPNVVKIVQTKPHVRPRLWTKQDGKVEFHPKSVNSDEFSFSNKFLIYHTKMKSSAVFLHDATMVTPFPLLFFGGDISVQRDDYQETIAVDDWIVFQAPRHIATMVKEMRRQLDSVLQLKVAQPRMDLYTPHSPTPSPSSQLIQAIIDLITTEDYSSQTERVASGKHLYSRSK